MIEGFDVTVTLQDALTSPYWAVIVVVPSETPVTLPSAETVATFSAAELQLRSSASIQDGVIVVETSAVSPFATAVLASLIADTGLKLFDPT